MHRTKVLLLAAGLGTRLGPLTQNTPKCLVPIAGRPILDYWFDRFKEAGLRQVMINTHHERDQVREYIRSVNETGEFQVRETYESDLLGSAGTISNNRQFADDADQVVVVYADNLSSVNLTELLSFHRGHEDLLTIMLYHAPTPSACGIAILDKDSRVIEFAEKPIHPKSDLANAGVYVVSSGAYREIADMNVFDVGYDVLPNFAGRMRGWVFHGYHRDIGSLASYDRAQTDVLRIFPQIRQSSHFTKSI